MSSNVLHTAGNVTGTASITLSLMVWFGENATAIGAITSVLLTTLTIVFYFLNYRLNKKRLELDIMKAKE